ncbi:LysR substrate-binding domain-containing protein [Phenylobacterium sp. VNQ135]|uniref:LysR substrate-binding domain-containing protein n=1 Tax=Phenylobacterium sp. VNQ135 TaxID=3400922 RepID=UPI003C0E5747
MASHRLPSLKGLQAFEAFARAGSMVRAAEILGVTHGAVSRQIKALERQLGAKLITGPRHGLTLTPAARKLAEAAAAGFAQIAAALPGAQVSEDLIVSAPSTFAMKWLIPRLPTLAASHPELRIRVVEDSASVDFGALGVNAAIRLHRGPAPHGMTVRPFLAHAFGPVLAPSRLAEAGDDLGQALRLPRLHSETFPEGWAQWAAAVGLDLPAASAEPSFEHNAYMLEAAAAGLGVAITAWAFAAPDIEQGRLIAPWGFARLPTRFHLIAPTHGRSPAVDTFARWLTAEGRRAAPPT